MPSALLLNLDELDLGRCAVTREQVYERLPHRHEFMQLDGIVHIDMQAKLAVGLRLVREDEFWVKGHIPGRPLFPGVLMLESAAQMASYLASEALAFDRFMAFAGLDKVKFREAVIPPARMYIIEKLLEVRPRRVIIAAQGVIAGKIVFEAEITGMPL